MSSIRHWASSRKWRISSTSVGLASTKNQLSTKCVSRNFKYRGKNPGTRMRRLAYRIWEQYLKSDDLPKRVAFCEWLFQKNREDLNLDQATFIRDGIFNSHSCQTRIPTQFKKHTFRIVSVSMVGAGMLGNHLIGLYILPPRLTGIAYLESRV